jgi:hypothetical protein
MKIQEYIVISDDDLGYFRLSVNRYLQSGWIISGSISTTHPGGAFRTIFTQALVRDTEEQTP